MNKLILSSISAVVLAMVSVGCASQPSGPTVSQEELAKQLESSSESWTKSDESGGPIRCVRPPGCSASETRWECCYSVDDFGNYELVTDDPGCAYPR